MSSGDGVGAAGRLADAAQHVELGADAHLLGCGLGRAPKDLLGFRFANSQVDAEVVHFAGYLLLYLPFFSANILKDLLEILEMYAKYTKYTMQLTKVSLIRPRSETSQLCR